jgi:integrase
MKAKYYRRSDNSGRWTVILYWKGKRYYRGYYDLREPLSSERLAHRIAEQINGDIEEKGKAFDPRRWFQPAGSEMAFKNYAEKWLGRQKHYAPSVIRDVHRYIQMAIDHFGLVDIREIRAAGVEDFAESLPAHLSSKTRKNILTVLRKLFSDAYRREDILRIPPFPVVSVPVPEVKWTTREWQDKIIDAIPERDRPIFVFCQTYGTRPGEARALQWDCVDFEKGIITIRRSFSGLVLRDQTKTNMTRYLPIIEPVESILRSLRGIGGFVFRNSIGNPYSPDMSRVWREARDRVGAPEVNLYQGTRHSLASQKVSEGHGLDRIRDLLGHTTTQTTRRYARTSVEGMRGLLKPSRIVDGPSEGN